MQKHLNKKGFTIVELVIVIVVIAILAAVLIPTFVSLTRKANEANDTAVAKNMNTALAQYSATNGKPETFTEVLDALEEAGYVLANLNASAKGNLYAWDKVNNQIVYLDKDGNVIYKNTDFNKADIQFIFAGDAADLPADYADNDMVLLPAPSAEKTLRDSLEDGRSVTLTQDVELKTTVVIPENATVTLDLGGKLCTTVVANSGEIAQKSEYIKVSEGATLTIQNGTFMGRGIMNNGGTIVVEDSATIIANDVNGGGCIRNKVGGEVIVNGGTFSVPNYIAWDETNYGGAAVIHNDGGKITVNGGTYTSNTDAYAISCNSGELIINDGNFTASRGVISCTGGKLTVNGGEFKVTGKMTVNGSVVENPNSAHVVYAGREETSEGTVEINGGDLVNEGKGYIFCVDSSTTTAKITVKSVVKVDGTAVDADLTFASGEHK